MGDGAGHAEAHPGDTRPLRQRTTGCNHCGCGAALAGLSSGGRSVGGGAQHLGVEGLGGPVGPGAGGQGPGHEAITLPDILGDGAPVEIPLDPAKTAIENAERYYDKARKTRKTAKERDTRETLIHGRCRPSHRAGTAGVCFR